MLWGPVLVTAATVLGVACAGARLAKAPTALSGSAHAPAPGESVVSQPLPPGVASTLASADAEPAGPGYRQPPCVVHPGMQWPVTVGVARLLADFEHSEPRDGEWAPRAERYLHHALRNTRSRGARRVALVECRRSACVVGAIVGGGLVFFDAMGNIPWAGPNGDAGGYALRPDNCHDALYVFWRNALDYPGAPGGRITSMQPTPPCPDSTPVVPGKPCIDWQGRCFKSEEAYCRCRCWLVPGAPHHHLQCLGEGRVGCDEAGLHFGTQWPPRWVQ